MAARRAHLVFAVVLLLGAFVDGQHWKGKVTTTPAKTPRKVEEARNSRKVAAPKKSKDTTKKAIPAALKSKSQKTVPWQSKEKKASTPSKSKPTPKASSAGKKHAAFAKSKAKDAKKTPQQFFEKQIVHRHYSKPTLPHHGTRARMLTEREIVGTGHNDNYDRSSPHDWDPATGSYGAY